MGEVGEVGGGAEEVAGALRTSSYLLMHACRPTHDTDIQPPPNAQLNPTEEQPT